jgi:hypothetical protein
LLTEEDLKQVDILVDNLLDKTMFNLSDMDHQRIEQMQTLYDDVLVDEIGETLEKQFQFEEELKNLK